MEEPKTTRFAVSLDESLLDDFDDLIKKSGYPSRSKAVQDLIRSHLIEQKWNQNLHAMGTITLVFNHHKRNLTEKLTEIQHDYPSQIIANTHVHLDHDNCLEVVIVKGKGRDIRELSDRLISAKGVIHGRLTLTAADQKEERE